MKKAAILSVGSELLEGLISNRNAQYLASELKLLGYSVIKIVTVGDVLEDIVKEVRELLSKVDLLVTTGGLGPTMDDLTREGVAEALGRKLYVDEELVRKIRERLSKRFTRIPDSVDRQAMVIEGAQIVENPVGTAPGQMLKVDGRIVLLLPGPPQELIPMFESVKDSLKTNNTFYQITLKYYSLPESLLEDVLRDILYAQRDVTVATMADHVEGVRLRLTTTMDKRHILDEMVEKILERTGDHLYGVNDERLEEVVVKLLKERGKTVAFAESCTGGLLSSTIVNVPGASEVFVGSVVAYDNEVKKKILGVREETLERFGAVSEVCVREMSEGLKNLMEADVCVAVSGIAGPTGGSPEKPVGTVFIDLFEKEHRTVKYHFSGDRNMIRTRSAMTSLELLRRHLKGV